ncbi:MAG: LytTR family transcriptional regulator DNA-binding domain-containing protein [Erysipelotrichia bacterium]|jgi:DNA-binding LytR/AlgR family response regulator|nr:LytTR family transcriptional regulator DNA-binding domain-containing protein [Erysipelotrichia bacterium]
MSQNTTFKQRLLTQFKVLSTLATHHLVVQENTSKVSLVDLSMSELERIIKANEEKGLILHGKTSLGNVRIFSEDVHLIESFGNLVLTTYKGKEVRFDLKLFELEEQLHDYGYVRVSKSMLVNTHHIEAVSSSFNAKLRLHLSNGIFVDVNRSYLKTFKTYMKERDNL